RFYVKGYERGITHKKAHGRVIGPISGGDEVAAAVNGAATRGPTADWYAEQAVEADAALMVSCRRDSVFGWAILIGVGGGLTELFDDAVVTALASHPAEAVRDQVRRGRLGRYLLAAGGNTEVLI